MSLLQRGLWWCSHSCLQAGLHFQGTLAFVLPSLAEVILKKKSIHNKQACSEMEWHANYFRRDSVCRIFWPISSVVYLSLSREAWKNQRYGEFWTSWGKVNPTGSLCQLKGVNGLKCSFSHKWVVEAVRVLLAVPVQSGWCWAWQGIWLCDVTLESVLNL